jgi:hypothetical protein
MVITNPVEVYSSGPMRVAIERDDVRAAVGGVGAAIGVSRSGRRPVRLRQHPGAIDNGNFNAAPPPWGP